MSPPRRFKLRERLTQGTRPLARSTPERGQEWSAKEVGQSVQWKNSLTVPSGRSLK
jgi:hypothetical protein